MDDASIQRILYNLAPVTPRNYVVMEVRSNLLADERQEYLKRFTAPLFKKVANVVMGEPPADFKKLQQARYLKQRQDAEEAAWKANNARKKIEAVRQKQLEEL